MKNKQSHSDRKPHGTGPKAAHPSKKTAAHPDRQKPRGDKPFPPRDRSAATAKPNAAPKRPASALRGEATAAHPDRQKARGEKPFPPRERSAATAKPSAAPQRPASAKKGDATAAKRPYEAVARKGSAAKPAAASRLRPAPEKPLLKCGQTLEISITDLNEDGFGVANHEGNRILVASSLPGEQLVVRVTYVGRRETFGTIIKALKSSPDRVKSSPCGQERACESCGVMHMRYPAQLIWKKQLVTRQMRHFASLGEVPVHDTIASPKQLEYRNSAKLVVAGKSANPVIGMYKRNSHDVMEIEDCALHHPLINKVVKAAKAGIRKGKVPIYHPKSEMGLLRYLVVRVAEPGDRVMVVLVTSEIGYNEIHHLAKYIQQEVPQVVVVAQNINGSTGNVIFGNRDRFITKAHTLRTQLGETSFTLSPRSFFQVNSGAARIIYEKVREFAALTGSERVIDLYCGIGGISLLLAKQAAEVVGIEVVEAAVADAIQNAALNGIRNCTFEAGDAARILDEIGSEGGADVIVLNPPRKGCEERVLKSAAALQPQKMIYVSCSPETLSRDLDILSRLGYRTVEVQPVDMFPQTVHVEDVALLVKQ